MGGSRAPFAASLLVKPSDQLTPVSVDVLVNPTVVRLNFSGALTGAALMPSLWSYRFNGLQYAASSATAAGSGVILNGVTPTPAGGGDRVHYDGGDPNLKSLGGTEIAWSGNFGF